MSKAQRTLDRLLLTAVLALLLSCGGPGPEEVTLVSRVPHDLPPLRCSGTTWTFGNDLERPTMLSETFRFLHFEDVDCQVELGDVTLRDSQGRTAVATGFTPISTANMVYRETTTPCGTPGGRANEPFGTGAIELVGDHAVQLIFDEGSAAELRPQTADFVRATCYAEAGSWIGTAGEYAGHSGTYRWLETTLQIELHLTPD